MKPKFIALLVVIILVAIILAQNTHVTTFNLLFWAVSVSQIIFIAIVLLGGFIIGYLTSMLIKRK